MVRRILIYSMLGLGLLLAGLFVFRAALVEALLADALATQGVAVRALSVAEVGLDEIHIADLRLGAGGELDVRSLRIAFEPAALLRGEIAHVTAEGLVLHLDLSGAAPPLGSLQPLVAGAGAGGGSPGPLPELELRDARIEAATPLGPVTATTGQCRRQQLPHGRCHDQPLRVPPQYNVAYRLGKWLGREIRGIIA